MRGYQESKKRDTERKRLYRERQRAMETPEEAAERRARQAEQIRQSRFNRRIQMSLQEQEAHRISEVARVKRLRQSQKVNKTENEIEARRKRGTLQVQQHRARRRVYQCVPKPEARQIEEGTAVNGKPLEASEWLKREVERVRQSCFPSQFNQTLQYQEVMRLPEAQQTKKSLDTPNYVKRNRLSQRDYDLMQMHDTSLEAETWHNRDQIKNSRLIKKINHPDDTQNEATHFKRNRLSEYAYKLIRAEESRPEPEPVQQYRLIQRISPLQDAVIHTYKRLPSNRLSQSSYELNQELETQQVPQSRIDQKAIQTLQVNETKNDSESEVDDTLSYQDAISLLMRRSPTFRKLMLIRLVQKQFSPKIF